MSLKRPESLIRLGYVALAFGLLFPRLVRTARPEWVDRLDALNGFFMGIAIGALLLGIWKRGRRTA